MDNKQKLAVLKQALSITEAMLDKANNALWDDISTLQQQRESLLNSIFPLDLDEHNEEIRISLEKLIELNSHLEKQCEQEKNVTKKQLLGINSNNKAVQAYTS